VGAVSARSGVLVSLAEGLRWGLALLRLQDILPLPRVADGILSLRTAVRGPDCSSDPPPPLSFFQAPALEVQGFNPSPAWPQGPG